MITDEELAYFDRWAAAMEAPSAGYTGDLMEDMQDRARRIRRLTARVRELQTKSSETEAPRLTLLADGAA